MTEFRGCDQFIVDQSIELSKGALSNSLGPDLELQGWTIVSRDNASGIIIGGLKMAGGRWVQKKKLSKMRFNYASFADVAFEGIFDDCMFGSLEDPKIASMVGCDFSQAKLFSCLFINVDPSEIKTASWPTIRFVEPQQFRDILPKLDMPKRLEISLAAKAKRDPAYKLSVDHAESLAKKAGIPVDALRGLLQQLPGVGF